LRPKEFADKAVRAPVGARRFDLAVQETIRELPHDGLLIALLLQQSSDDS